MERECTLRMVTCEFVLFHLHRIRDINIKGFVFFSISLSLLVTQTFWYHELGILVPFSTLSS